VATLFGKLREYELELGRLKEEEKGDKRKNIALKGTLKSANKSKTNKAKTMGDQDDGNSDNETLNMMVKWFS